MENQTFKLRVKLFLFYLRLTQLMEGKFTIYT